MRYGIVIAAGGATRFGGYYKELLPISEGRHLLDAAIERCFIGGADKVFLVTNRGKIDTHAYHLAGKDYLDDSKIILLISEDLGQDFWGSIYTALLRCDMRSAEVIFTMSDTFIPSDTFKGFEGTRPVCYAFETDDPSNYGIIQDGEITNKPDITGSGLAWGAWTWDTFSTQKLLTAGPDITYTEAFNLLLPEASIEKMDYYYDMGDFARYKKFCCEWSV